MGLKLYEYQQTGAEWLSRRKVALLADRPRLGKTPQVIHATDRVNATRVVVICRAVARDNWSYEFNRFSTSKKHHVIIRGCHIPPIPEDNFVIIASYSNLKELLENESIRKGFDVLICDESHSIKSTEAVRSRQIFGKDGLCRLAKRVWCLTGTPAPNHAGELWTTLYTFGATTLSYWDFVKKFCLTRESGYGTQITGTNTDKKIMKELHEIMDKVTLRRTETSPEVKIELPKMHFSTVMVEPGKVHLASTSYFKYVIPADRTAEFNKMVEAELGIFQGILDGGLVGDELLEVLKAQAKSISTLSKYTALQKLDPVCDLIRSELEAGAYKKCVIFAHHKDAIEGCRIRLLDYHPVTLYGASNPVKVEKNIKSFQSEKGKARVFIGNILAAGTSITLDAANHIFFVEEDWTPGNNVQASMRCSGPNQKKPVFVRNFCLNNSLDQRKAELLRDKATSLAKIYRDNEQTKIDTAAVKAAAEFEDLL